MVRAKFEVVSVTQFQSGHTILMHPVISGSEENKQFYQYTPGGKLELSIVSEATAEQFEVGKSYYIDFTPAD